MTRLWTLLIAIALTPALASTAGAADFTADVTASALNVRTRAWGSVLGQVQRGQSFVVRGQSSGWYRINYQGRDAWVSASYMSRSSRSIVTVTASSLNVRSGASVNYRKVGATARGQRYVQLDRSGSWIKIQYDNRTGWVHGSYTSAGASSGGTTPAPTPAPAPAPTGSDLRTLDLVLDSGHGVTSTGTFDPGAVNRFNRITEYDLNRRVVTRVKQLLQARGARVTAYIYTPGSVRRSLTSKGRVARGADVFVSIHHNAFNASVQGTETLVHNTRSTSSSRSLASAIQSRVSAALWGSGSSRNRGVKRRALSVLSGAHSVMNTACLVEGFFLDPASVTPSVANGWVERESQAIAAGIAAYWKNR